ncbi:hypothetical protein DRO19_01080 [Candidatus Bathyarchaeota archaeon]|nr:MAG: hypothetical protein DRO19_01080 [Candidatus Bathyarchaeota archaeon]
MKRKLLYVASAVVLGILVVTLPRILYPVMQGGKNYMKLHGEELPEGEEFNYRAALEETFCENIVQISMIFSVSAVLGIILWFYMKRTI